MPFREGELEFMEFMEFMLADKAPGVVGMACGGTQSYSGTRAEGDKRGDEDEDQ